MATLFGPLRHISPSGDVSTVIDPRFGESATPAQPSGWGGGGGGGAANLPLVDAASYGALGDGRDATGSVTMTAGSTTVTGASNTFSSADTGKTVWLLGSVNVHKTTIIAATSTTLTISSAPSFSASDGVAVIGTDNGPALTAAVIAARQFGAAGIQLGPGLYLTDTVLPALNNTRDFRISGASAGGMSYGRYVDMDTSPGTELRHMGSGAGTFINASYTRGFTLTDLAVRVGHPGFTGAILNLDHTWASYVQRFVLGGVWEGKNATAVKDTHTVETQFTDGMVERCAVGMDAEGSGYSNANTYTRVVWLACGTSLRGPRTQATFLSCVWEPQGGSMTTDPLGDVSPITGRLRGATFIGCGWWDAIAANGAWIRPDTGSYGVVILGGYYEPRTANEALVRPSGTLDGLVVTGLHSRGYDHTGSRVLDLSAGTVTALDYRANAATSTTTSGLESVSSGVAFEPDTGFRRVVARGNSGTALTLRTAGTQTATLTGNVALTFPTLPAGSSVTIDLFLTQDATGSRTVTWPASVRWDGGSAPTITATAAHTTHVQLTTVNGGTTWLGRRVGTYAP